MRFSYIERSWKVNDACQSLSVWQNKTRKFPSSPSPTSWVDSPRLANLPNYMPFSTNSHLDSINSLLQIWGCWIILYSQLLNILIASKFPNTHLFQQCYHWITGINYGDDDHESKEFIQMECSSMKKELNNDLLLLLSLWGTFSSSKHNNLMNS